MLSSSSICHICKQDTKFKSESAFEFYLIKVWLPPLPITALSGARQALKDKNVLVKGGSTISINVGYQGRSFIAQFQLSLMSFFMRHPQETRKPRFTLCCTNQYMFSLPFMVFLHLSSFCRYCQVVSAYSWTWQSEVPLVVQGQPMIRHKLQPATQL